MAPDSVEGIRAEVECVDALRASLEVRLQVFYEVLGSGRASDYCIEPPTCVLPDLIGNLRHLMNAFVEIPRLVEDSPYGDEVLLKSA